jgi:glyoxylase-like metal-dependent hydrolase (beta-lactamase superfamily II)
MIVDPSASVSAIMAAVAAEGANIEGILITHGHFDHILSLDLLRDATGAPAYIHEEDAEMLTDGNKNMFFYAYGKDRAWREAEHLLKDGDEIPLGNEKIKVIHTPGHSKGSVCFLCGDTLVSGDTLFAETVGRTDLYGGSSEILEASLSRLRELDPKLPILPGHGPDGTLGIALDISAYLF